MLENGQNHGVLTMEESPIYGHNQQATLFARGFLAGMFVGEGSIGFMKYNNPEVIRFRCCPRIRIANTDYAIIRDTAASLEVLNIPHCIQKSKSNDKMAWNVCVIGWKRVKRFIDVMLPFIVGNKKFQLDQAKKLIDSRLSKSNKIPYTSDEMTWIEAIKVVNKTKRIAESSETKSNPS